MARRVFLSYQHEDQLKAKGFNLMRYNQHLALEFTTRGLLDPVKSRDDVYISAKIREQMKGTSVTVVLLGDNTCDSKWVAREIEWSLEKDPPNGIVAIKLHANAEIPDSLAECEVLDWNSPADVTEFSAAVERAARAERRMSQASALVGPRGSSCVR
jgi:hypothetical protein